MNIFINALLSILVVSLVSLVGAITFIFKEKRLRSILIVLISFSTGSMFGGAFLHLLPEASEQLGPGMAMPLFVLLGIVVFYVLENFIHWRHCHIPTSSSHPHPLGIMNLVGDGFHNLLDGMIIAASYMVSTQIGIVTTLAVLLHEIPQEIGDFGVLIHAGYSKKAALGFNLLSACSAFLGAIFIFIIGPGSKISSFLLPFTAGGFIYIAGSDLIPELKKECYPLKKLFLQLASLVFGILVMYLFTFVE